MRIRALSGCLATSAMAIIGTGAAAQAAHAATLSGTSSGWSETCPSGEQYSYQHKCCKPVPNWQWVFQPSPVATTPTAVYTTAPVTTVTVSASAPSTVPSTAAPTASPTAVAPVVASSSPVPSGPANTGGGLPASSDIPLAAGGGAVALIAAPLGLVALRRWRQTRGTD